MKKVEISPSSIARKRLLRLLEGQEKAGCDGLPGLRELCGILGVSLMTVRKVVQELAAEGRIRIVPNKGHFLVRSPRQLEIGILCESNVSGMMVKNLPVLRGLLDVLDQANCLVRFVFSPKLERLHSIFAGYDFAGCFWFLPELPLFKQVRQTIRLADFPVVPVIQRWAMAHEKQLPPHAVVSDHYAAGYLRANYLLRRGHRKIARLNVNYYPERGDEGEEFLGFQAALSRCGDTYSPDWSISPDKIDERLPELLACGEVTAAVVNGGLRQMSNVFQILGQLPHGDQLELLPDDVGSGLVDLIGQYPHLSVVGVNFAPDYALGATAGRRLLRHLREGEELDLLKVSPEEPRAWSPALYAHETDQTGRGRTV